MHFQIKWQLAGLVLGLLGILPLAAQHSIQSRVYDGKNGEALEMVTVRLFRSSDSTLVQGVQTDLRGGFALDHVKPGRYYLLVTSIGYRDYQTDITMGNRDIILKNIQLEEDAQLLSEIEVKGTAAQMLVRGDTLEYNATAFKTAENYAWHIAHEGGQVLGFVPMELRKTRAIFNNYYVAKDSPEVLEALLRHVKDTYGMSPIEAVAHTRHAELFQRNGFEPFITWKKYVKLMYVATGKKS